MNMLKGTNDTWSILLGLFFLVARVTPCNYYRLIGEAVPSLCCQVLHPIWQMWNMWRHCTSTKLHCSRPQIDGYDQEGQKRSLWPIGARALWERQKAGPNGANTWWHNGLMCGQYTRFASLLQVRFSMKRGLQKFIPYFFVNYKSLQVISLPFLVWSFRS